MLAILFFLRFVRSGDTLLWVYFLLFFEGLGRLGAPFWRYFRHFGRPWAPLGTPWGPFGQLWAPRRGKGTQHGDFPVESLTPFSHFWAQFRKKTSLFRGLFLGPVFSSILVPLGRAQPSQSIAPANKITVSA